MGWIFRDPHLADYSTTGVPGTLGTTPNKVNFINWWVLAPTTFLCGPWSGFDRIESTCLDVNINSKTRLAFACSGKIHHHHAKSFAMAINWNFHFELMLNNKIHIALCAVIQVSAPESGPREGPRDHWADGGPALEHILNNLHAMFVKPPPQLCADWRQHAEQCKR